MLLHFFRKFDRCRIIVEFFRPDLLLSSFFDGRFERPNPDPNCPQVVTLINFKAGVEAVVLVHNFFDLVGINRVEPTAKGVQLDEFQFWRLGRNPGRRVQAGVVGPLVDHPQAANVPQVGN